MSEVVVTDHERTMTASGSLRSWTDPAAACADLRSGRARAAVGCLAFDSDHPSALTEPRSITVRAGGLDHRPGVAPVVTGIREIPDPRVHVDRVRSAVSRIRAGELEKVVLARALRLTTDAPMPPRDLLARMCAADHLGRGFLAALDAAGPEHHGTHVVGSSPELLVRRRGRRVFSHPLAGTTPRRADREEDRRAALELQTSEKDMDEHRHVVEAIEAVLAPLCTSLNVPPLPTLTHTSRTWHLGTPIHGELADPETGVLELAAALHPTPAVCGTPEATARRLIADIEGDRGFYGGAVGWCDAEGDGEWRVILRAAVLDADGTSLLAHAGGGIVAASDPDDELAETSAKFGPVLDAVACPDALRAVTAAR